MCRVQETVAHPSGRRLATSLAAAASVSSAASWAFRSGVVTRSVSGHERQRARQRLRHSSFVPGRWCSSMHRQPQVARRSIIEGLVGSIVLYTLLRPAKAPGASELLKQQQKEAAADVVAAAKDAETDKQAPERSGARERLRKALKRLSEVEAKLKGAEADEAEYPLPPYLKEYDGTGRVMFAVTGAAGVGKSSLVNALRRLKDSDPEAARTGLNETTLDPEVFMFPSGYPKDGGLLLDSAYRQLDDDHATSLACGDRVLVQGLEGTKGMCSAVLTSQKSAGGGDAASSQESWEAKLKDGSSVAVARDQIVAVAAQCVVWDLPGIGTPNYPQASYLKRMGVRYFDAVLLVTSTRFTEAELMLAEELQNFEVPFFMVRNKVDVDVQSEIDREEEEGELSPEQREEVAQQTVNCIKSYFGSEYGLDKVYCISTRRKLREQYDFKLLENDLEEAVKRQRGTSATAS